MIGDMVGRPQPVVIELSAKNPDVLGNVAPQVAAAIAKIPGIEPDSVNNGVIPAGDALEIHVDCGASGMEGHDPGRGRGAGVPLSQRRRRHPLPGRGAGRRRAAVARSARAADLSRPARPIADPLARRPCVSAANRGPDQLCRGPARDHPRQSRPGRRGHRGDRRRPGSRLDHRRGAAGTAPAGAVAGRMSTTRSAAPTSSSRWRSPA